MFPQVNPSSYSIDLHIHMHPTPINMNASILLWIEPSIHPFHLIIRHRFIHPSVEDVPPSLVCILNMGQVEWEDLLPYKDFAIRIPHRLIWKLPALLKDLLQDTNRVRLLCLSSFECPRDHN